MRKPKIESVIFDMDGTIAFRDASDASYISFFRRMGLEDQARVITSKYDDPVRNVMSPDNHQRQFEETVALLRGKRATEPREIFPSIPYAPGFQEFCRYLRSHGINTGIVTLSLLYAADLIREENDMQLAYANEIHILDGIFTGTGTLHVRFGSKGTMVRKAYESLASVGERTAYIGDSLNDIDPWSSVALPLGVNLHHPDCRQYVVADFADFREVLDFFKSNVDLQHKLK